MQCSWNQQTQRKCLNKLFLIKQRLCVFNGLHLAKPGLNAQFIKFILSHMSTERDDRGKATFGERFKR